MLIIWKFPRSIAGRTKTTSRATCGPRVWDPGAERPWNQSAASCLHRPATPGESWQCIRLLLYFATSRKARALRFKQEHLKNVKFSRSKARVVFEGLKPSSWIFRLHRSTRATKSIQTNDRI